MSVHAENVRESPDKQSCVWIVEGAKSTIERTLRRKDVNDFLRRVGEHLYDHASGLYVAVRVADLPPELHDG